jgi:hypothetical protein
MTVAAEFLPHLSIRLAMVRAGVAARIQGIVAVLKDFAPYAAVVLILPGGSLLALLLWLYRRHQKSDLAVCVGHADAEPAS